MTPFGTLLEQLRAAGEPSRLRLLQALAAGEFSVTELTRIVGQSQPRVSRHLRLLCQAGLLERFRERHWVCYRVASSGYGHDLVASLLSRVDRDDPVLRADRDRIDAVRAERRREATRGKGTARDS